MAILESDIKRLWGKAAGRCSMPSCGIDCLPFLDISYPTIIGEMAHIIPKSTTGPRAGDEPGSHSYSNLILLCPTHHTLIDKAPEGTFPRETLLEWKVDHEVRVRASLESPVFSNRSSLNQFVHPKLIENRVAWATYGPESETAKANPLSSAAFFWPFRKFSLVVPNNRAIISAIQANFKLFNTDEYTIARQFVEHAEGFERNCMQPTENVPRFPKEFGEMFSE